MHIEDITFAMNRGHLSDIEGAFRALVLYPNEDDIEGLATVPEAVDLLNRVAAVLYEDTRIMPGHVVDFIKNECEDGALTAATYAAGSRAVREHMMRWRGFFAATSLARGER